MRTILLQVIDEGSHHIYTRNCSGDINERKQQVKECQEMNHEQIKSHESLQINKSTKLNHNLNTYFRREEATKKD